MDLLRQQGKIRKYKFLSRFPGRIGRIYQEKLANRVLHFETYKAFDEALRHCSQMICIDIGANVGTITSIMAQSASRVFAFEPDPWAFTKLSYATEKLQNVTLINAAAGISDNDVRLFRRKEFDSDPILHSAASSVFMNKHSDTGNTFLVEQVDIINFLLEMEEDFGIIKIDAEGAEVPILERLLDHDTLANKIHYVFAETHERIFPELSARYLALRNKCDESLRPHVNLNWP